jgi:hypothetical protein
VKELLSRIPLEPRAEDSWQGVPLPPVYYPLETRQGEAWFVDGGNAAIIEAPHFSLQKFRAVAVHYPDKTVRKKEGFCLVTRTDDGWQLRGDVTGIVVGEIEDAVSRGRQQLEHDLAKECLGLVVLDGDIAPEGCISLQKTITVLTKNHFPLSSVLSKPGPWHCRLGSVHAVKLDSRARHVFLAHNASPEQLGVLSYYSSDTLFPGYPQGLVLADRLARISKEEAVALRIQAKAMLKDLRRISEAEAAIDSHSILDTMG